MQLTRVAAWHGMCDLAASMVKAAMLGTLRVRDVMTETILADPRRSTDGRSTVGDLMTRVVYAVRTDDPVLASVRMMVAEDIHRVVVVHEDGGRCGR